MPRINFSCFDVLQSFELNCARETFCHGSTQFQTTQYLTHSITFLSCIKMFKTPLADAAIALQHHQNIFEVLREYVMFKQEQQKRSDFWFHQKPVVPTITHVGNMSSAYIQAHVARLEDYLRKVDGGSLSAVIDNWQSILEDLNSVAMLSVTDAVRERNFYGSVIKLETEREAVSKADIQNAAQGLVQMSKQKRAGSGGRARGMQRGGSRRSSRTPKTREFFDPDHYVTVMPRKRSRLEMTPKQIEAYAAQEVVLDLDCIDSDSESEATDDKQK